MKKTISFRIDDNDLKELGQEASNSLITTNQLVNQIIHNYLVWERHVRKLKFIPVSDELIMKFLESNNDEMQNISKIVYGTLKDITLQTFKVFDFDAFLITLKAYCFECSFHVDDKTEGNIQRIVINHNLGIKFSHIVKQIFELAFKEFNISHSCDQTPNTVLINRNMIP
jgi:hypothetical protein